MENSRRNISIVVGSFAAILLIVVYFFYFQPQEKTVVKSVQYITDGTLQPMLASLLGHPAAGLVSNINIKDNQIRLLADDQVQYLVTYQTEAVIAELYDYFKKSLSRGNFSIVSDMPDNDFTSFTLDASDGHSLYHIYAVKNETGGRSFSKVAVSFLIR